MSSSNDLDTYLRCTYICPRRQQAWKNTGNDLERKDFTAMQFQWDTGNTAHIALHDITPEEAEQVIENDPFEISKVERNGELRIVHVGETDAGRVLLVAVTNRAELVRVITAYTANGKLASSTLNRKPKTEETNLDDT